MVCSFKLHFVSKNLKIKDITKRSYKREKNKEKAYVCVYYVHCTQKYIYVRSTTQCNSDNRLERKSKIFFFNIVRNDFKL